MESQDLRDIMDSFGEQISSSKTSKTITREKYDRIVHHLRNPELDVDPHFKAWVKNKKFSLLNFPLLEITDVLIIPTEDKESNSKDTDPNFMRVIPVDMMFDVIQQIHCKELQHAGYKKVLEKVKVMFYGIPRSYVQEYCKNCPVCQLSAPQSNRSIPLVANPIRLLPAGGFLSRVQIDLIDMQHDPDGDYKWLGHFMDHFTKYHVLFPLVSSTAKEVAEKLQERVLAHFGVPKIFHSNNGREFVKELLHVLFEQWNGDVVFIRGLPQHSQIQSLIDNENEMLEKRLTSMKAEKQIIDNTPWSSWLPRIQYDLNVTAQKMIKETPYSIVFGQQPPSLFVPGLTINIIDEEDLNVQNQPDQTT